MSAPDFESGQQEKQLFFLPRLNCRRVLSVHNRVGISAAAKREFMMGSFFVAAEYSGNTHLRPDRKAGCGEKKETTMKTRPMARTLFLGISTVVIAFTVSVFFMGVALSILSEVLPGPTVFLKEECCYHLIWGPIGQRRGYTVDFANDLRIGYAQDLTDFLFLRAYSSRVAQRVATGKVYQVERAGWPLDRAGAVQAVRVSDNLPRFAERIFDEGHSKMVKLWLEGRIQLH